MVKNKKILIVDDKPENIYSLNQILKDTDAQIINASNGNEALIASLHNDFAMAILDVQMPEMDGYELAELLRSEKKTNKLPIIFVSAVYSDDYHVFRGYDSGAVDFLVKPFNAKILLSKVGIFLELDLQKNELEARVLERTAELEKKNKDLSVEIGKRETAEKKNEQLLYDLGERIKELNCLYSISKLAEKPGMTVERLIEGIVSLLPSGLQYSDITCARIILENEEYKTNNFRETKWKQSANIISQGKIVGTVTVCYLEEKQKSDEGYFLKEEKNLILTLAERLGKIIQRRNTEEKFEKQKRRLERKLIQSQKMESMGKLAGGIAHDFNNLLYMISGNAELALEDIPKWNPVHTNLEEIKSASLRAAGIVKQLLSFSQKTDQELNPIGAVTVIKDTLKFLRSTIPTTIEIRKHLPDADITILADPVQINQVLMNLCINASQAMEESGGTLEVSIEKTICEAEDMKEFSDLVPGNYLKITVNDTGPGISPEIINRIFDPYFTTKEMGKGSGMGLSIVHGIVKNHNGAVSVDSNPGKGTTFSILIPVIDKKPEIGTEIIDKIPRGHETILFVDDEESITNMTGQMLERLGYRMETSLNPIEALDLFQSKPEYFDLVITDMTMPQMTGAKLAQKLKEIQPDVPVIICTGHSSLIDEEKAKQFGIAGYVMKPASMSTIAKAIRNVLDKSIIFQPIKKL